MRIVRPNLSAKGERAVSLTGAHRPAPLIREEPRPQRLYEHICDRIVALAREKRLSPGDRFPPERDLAKLLSVSRTSVREAMIALETAGVIDVRTGSGCYLRVSLGNAFRLPWGASEDPGPGAFEQFQVRMLIEPRVAELAAPIIDVALLDRFDDLLDRTEAAIGAGRPDGDEDYQFHVQLAEHCGNSLLARLVRELWDLRDAEMWRRLRLRVVQPELKIQSLVDRRSIVAACRVRDSRRAKATMTRLLRRAESWFFTKR